ncbi:hypothetical protein ANCDUO_13194 [Ancylostoma duodenale]|uniref:Uncharacterized protein n=1 Tax=Ancylostoma duodenale TaxID=51022 RepID=A0A0C2G6K9_9BILA|nr:hypothetical protein ANCDUO_13194 [Ancylostoma duodenale]
MLAYDAKMRIYKFKPFCLKYIAENCMQNLEIFSSIHLREERVHKDREIGIDQENGDEVVRQTSKLLEELFKTHSRHPEFIQAVIWCMRALIKKGAFSEENQSAIKLGVDGLAAVFSTKSLWMQSQILYRYNLPELSVLLANAFRSSRDGVTVPVRLLLQGRSHVGTEVEMFLPSYAMAMGENSAFNLGLAADGPVREARKVPLEAVSDDLDF